MTLKKRAFPGLMLVPETLRQHSIAVCVPISAVVWTDLSKFSVGLLEFITDTLVVLPKLCAGL